MAQIVRVCFELVRVRAKSCSVYLEQYPLRCVAMLVDDGGGQEIARAFCHMKATAYAFQQASGSPYMHVQQDAKDSFVIEADVQRVFEQAAEKEYNELAEEMAVSLVSMFWIGQIHVVESGFPRLRFLEEQTKHHNVTAAGRCWAALFQREVLSRVFEYREVGPSECSDLAASALKETRIEQNMFKSQVVERQSFPLRSIMG